MWSDVITIYRKHDSRVERIVAENCHIETKVEQTKTVMGEGERQVCSFFLPGAAPVFPGDRVVAGIGPEVYTWAQVNEDHIPGLVELIYTKPYFCHGRLHHTEAHNR
jgi:hypothetical protein